MKKINFRSIGWGFESIALALLSAAFIFVMMGAWNYSAKLRETAAINAAGMNLDPTPLIEVEKIRGLADAQMADARSFFLLGSTALMEKQKTEKQSLLESLIVFEKKYSLPGLVDIKARLEALVKAQEDIFTQAMDFREKKTESKIVGQFYHSKTVPIRAKMTEALDEIVRLHNAELDRLKANAKAAGIESEAMIPRGMKLFTQLLGGIFLGLALLMIQMLLKRPAQTAERNRLYSEATQAIIDRDEVISAVSYNLKESMQAITDAANKLSSPSGVDSIGEQAEVIKSSVAEIQGSIDDIRDQKNAELKGLSLRVDQLGIEEIFEQAELMLKPLAKQRDIRLQFEPVNPPVSAFADRDRVLRVLSNLIGNAIKFSPRHSRVLIKVRGDQQFVNISVTDGGPGIPEKQLNGIFDNFWQAKKTASEGAGVGLAVVKTLVEAQGGTVKVDTLGSNGSTFTFSLPRRRPVGVQMKKPSSLVRSATVPVPLAVTAVAATDRAIGRSFESAKSAVVADTAAINEKTNSPTV
jgi:signal transduction histidine kinase